MRAYNGRQRPTAHDLGHPPSSWKDDGCGGQCRQSLECPFETCIMDWEPEARRQEVQRALRAGEMTVEQARDRFDHNRFYRSVTSP